MVKDTQGGTALHATCMFKSSIEVVSKLLEIGWNELLMVTHDYGNKHYKSDSYNKYQEQQLYGIDEQVRVLRMYLARRQVGHTSRMKRMNPKAKMY